MASTKETDAPATGLRAHGHDSSSTFEDLVQEGQELMEEGAMFLRDSQRPARSPAGSSQPASSIPGELIKPARRNKLAFKNRWLISADIVAALRRAGVHCDIVLPPLYVDAPGLTRH